MTVPLPETGDGSRRRRRRERQRGWRRIALRVVGGVVVVALLGVLGWALVGLLTRDDDGSAAAPGTTSPDGEEVAEPPSLVVLRGAGGDVYGLTVFAPQTATVVHVPPGTLLEVPSLGLVPLRDAGAAGDELLVQSLENLLGVRFDTVSALGPDDLAAAVDAVAPLSVAVPDAVEDRTATGRVTVVVPSGIVPLEAVDVATFLEVVGTGTSLQRLVRHQAFWSAYLDAGADGIAAVAAMDGGDDVVQRVLPVEAVAGIEGDEELYRVVEDDLAALVARVFPDAIPAGGARIRVQILNGVGRPGVAQLVQPLLVDAGARMTLSGNADRFDYAITQIVYYADEHLDDARAIQAALGVGEVVKSLTGLDVVDVTVVVGADFLASNPGG